jgi:type 1 fimbria pilin
MALFSTGAMATSKLNFHGTLYKLSCVVNNDKPISINFGQVGVNKVDGVNYSTAIPLTIQCDEKPSAKLNLTVTGVASDFNNGAVRSTISNLAIEIQQNGVPVELGKSFLVNAENPPTLVAVPVKRPGGELSGGDFNAVATLIVQGD